MSELGYTSHRNSMNKKYFECVYVCVFSKRKEKKFLRLPSNTFKFGKFSIFFFICNILHIITIE